jgi:hypothetical protein
VLTGAVVEYDEKIAPVVLYVTTKMLSEDGEILYRSS